MYNINILKIIINEDDHNRILSKPQDYRLMVSYK